MCGCVFFFCALHWKKTLEEEGEEVQAFVCVSCPWKKTLFDTEDPRRSDHDVSSEMDAHVSTLDPFRSLFLLSLMGNTSEQHSRRM